jgi:hypothetical protein
LHPVATVLHPDILKVRIFERETLNIW